jgi:hypothetical protein
MRSISLAALLLAGCAAQAEPLNQQIEKNWNVAIGTPCHRAFEVQVGLAPDGTVKSFEPTEPVAADDAACKYILEALKRAVLLSSPLQFDGEAPPRVNLRVGPELWQPQ